LRTLAKTASRLKTERQRLVDWLTFVSTMTKALAWPIVVLLLMYIIRDRLGDVVSRLIEVTFPGGSVKFADELDKSRITSERVLLQQAAKGEDTVEHIFQADNDSNFLALTQEYPELSVLESFKSVESAVLEVAFSFGIDTKHKNMRSIVSDLHQREILSGDIVGLFSELAQLRNVAAHAGLGNPITPAQAEIYREQSTILTRAIRDALKRNQQP
jgi:hypothetical protein